MDMKIRWLHISDIHFELNNYGTERLREALLEKINEKGRGYYKYLFITGDLLYRYGQQGDFTNVELFLESLLKKSGIEKDNIFIVPGNHDIIRDEDVELSICGIRTKLDKNHNNVNKIPCETYIRLLNRQNEYKKFYERFLGRNYEIEKLHYFYEKEDINILGINSCLIAGTKEDEGKLSVDLNKLLECIKDNERNKKKVSIAILHHELEYLNEYEREEIKRLLIDKNFDFIFCGHTHKNRFDRYNVGNKELIKVCTAALAKDEENYSDINFVEGIVDGSNIMITYYKWYDELSQWKRDICIDRAADEAGVIEFNIKKDIAQFKQNMTVENIVICDKEKEEQCKEKLGNIYAKNKMQEKYVEFIKDSKEVYILVKDLDFLLDPKIEDELKKIEILGSECKILIQEKDEFDDNIKKLIMRLQSRGVHLKMYPVNNEENIRNIKGQFKINKNGNYECLVIGNHNIDTDKFKLFDMNNRFISAMFWKTIKSFFESEEELKNVELGDLSI